MKKTIELWEEGFAASGESSTAAHIGTFLADDIDDAVKQYMAANPNIKIDWERYGPHRHANWGCEIFDNEADARKSFG